MSQEKLGPAVRPAILPGRPDRNLSVEAIGGIQPVKDPATAPA